MRNLSVTQSNTNLCKKPKHVAVIIFNYTGQLISKRFFVSVTNMLLIDLFASMKLEKGHKIN